MDSNKVKQAVQEIILQDETGKEELFTGVVVYRNGRPFLNADSVKNSTVSTVQCCPFPVYEILSTFISVCAVKLCSKEIIDLDERLGFYHPGIYPRWVEKITLRQILNCSSGISDFQDLQGFQEELAAHPLTPWPKNELIGRALSRGPLFKPGQGWHFSNTAILILIECLEKICRLSIETVLENEVLHDAGLISTGYIHEPSEAEIFVPGYTDVFSIKEGLFHDSRLYCHPGWYGGLILYSSLNDLCQFMSYLFECRLFSCRFLREMTEAGEIEFNEDSDFRPGYGLGLMTDLGSTFKSEFGHLGSGPGYCVSAYAYELDQDLYTISAMHNSDNPDRIESTVRKIMEKIKMITTVKRSDCD